MKNSNKANMSSTGGIDFRISLKTLRKQKADIVTPLLPKTVACNLLTT
jgi:hypothetical protein